MIGVSKRQTNIILSDNIHYNMKVDFSILQLMNLYAFRYYVRHWLQRVQFGVFLRWGHKRQISGTDTTYKSVEFIANGFVHSETRYSKA